MKFNSIILSSSIVALGLLVSGGAVSANSQTSQTEKTYIEKLNHNFSQSENGLSFSKPGKMPKIKDNNRQPRLYLNKTAKMTNKRYKSNRYLKKSAKTVNKRHKLGHHFKKSAKTAYRKHRSNKAKYIQNRMREYSDTKRQAYETLQFYRNYRHGSHNFRLGFDNGCNMARYVGKRIAKTRSYRKGFAEGLKINYGFRVHVKDALQESHDGQNVLKDDVAY